MLDAVAILQGPPGRAEAARWASRVFATQVGLIRRHLAPITEPGLLVSSFGREAAHARAAGAAINAVRSPVRVAYALRWIELVTEMRLPDWSLWVSACTPNP